MGAERFVRFVHEEGGSSAAGAGDVLVDAPQLGRTPRRQSDARFVPEGAGEIAGCVDGSGSFAIERFAGAFELPMGAGPEGAVGVGATAAGMPSRARNKAKTNASAAA